MTNTSYRAGRRAGELIGSGLLRVPGTVWGVIWAVNCAVWAVAWAFVAAAPSEPGFSYLIAAGSVISALIAFSCVGKASARSWDGQASLPGLFAAWRTDAQSSRFRATVTVLPLSLLIVGLSALASSTWRGTGALVLVVGVALFIFRGIRCGHIVAEQQGTEYARDQSFIARVAAVLGLDPARLEDCLLASPDRTVTVRPVPPQAIAHIPNLEAQLAVHMADYEVSRADVEAIVLVPASEATAARREAIQASGGLVSGFGTPAVIAFDPQAPDTPDFDFSIGL